MICERLCGPGMETHRAEGSAHSGSAGNDTRARIWLVEDNPDDVYLVQKAMAHRGIPCDLTCFADGEKAIRAISECQNVPDLILIDLKLPRRDGFDVLRAVRSTPSLVDVPIGILTSSNAETDRHRASLQGIKLYILKPADYDQFLERVGDSIASLLA